MASFSVPLSGLQASASALQVIGNNLANLNTDGFKDQTLSFGDIFSDMQGTSGNGDPIQIGSGVQIVGTTSDLTNGSVNATGTASNMALQGNGYFVVNDNGETSYTRDGNFSVNPSGQLTTSGGDLVMGFPAVNGVVSTSGALVPITVNSNGTAPASATSTFQVEANLDSASTVGTSFNTPLTIYDSLGTSQTLNIQYTNTGVNTWSYNVTLPDSATGSTATATSSSAALVATTPLAAGSVTSITDGTTGTVLTFTAGTTSTVGDLQTAIADAAGGTPLPNGAVLSGTGAFSSTAALAINTSGQAVISTGSGADTLQVSTNDSALGTFNAGATTTVAAGTLTFNSSGQLTSPTGAVAAINITGLTDKAANMSLTWNLNDSAGNPTITQQNTASVSGTTPIQDGYGAGSLKSYTVLSDGTVQGQYSNGQTMALGQVAVANFTNPQGLAQTGDGNEMATTGSGAAVIGQAGVGGNGTITGGSVEGSNVSLSTEFANMIVAQQSYDANAKVLTTLNQVDQSTIQMVS